jgi:hypothetical protein
VADGIVLTLPHIQEDHCDHLPNTSIACGAFAELCWHQYHPHPGFNGRTLAKDVTLCGEAVSMPPGLFGNKGKPTAKS